MLRFVPFAIALAVPAAAQQFDFDDFVVPQGIEFQARGPIHEAFAEPVIYDPQPGYTVPRQPPDPIEELPPDEQPEGDDVAWISGYWAWDEDRDNFIWVSGIWRNLPPGKQFIPGYWTQADGGWQWVSGFWYNLRERPVAYLPQPPESLEVGPSSDPPAPDHVWVPGSWLYRESRYVWRPGYWLAPQPQWTWVPAHYVWTPSGYVFVGGYWDYEIVQRGLLFAPAYIEPAVIRRPAFVYRPQVVVDSTILIDFLFARPRHRHYYFGDYFGRDYFRRGIYPTYAFHQSRYGYDPIFASYYARHRLQDPNWFDRFRSQYRHRRDHADARPPRVFRPDPRGGVGVVIARPLQQFARSPNPSIRLRRMDDVARQRVRQGITSVRDVREQRRKLELGAVNRSPLRAADRTQARPLELAIPRSPLAGRPLRSTSAAQQPAATPGTVIQRQVPDRPGTDRTARPVPNPTPDRNPPRTVTPREQPATPGQTIQRPAPGSDTRERATPTPAPAPITRERATPGSSGDTARDRTPARPEPQRQEPTHSVPRAGSDTGQQGRTIQRAEPRSQGTAQERSSTARQTPQQTANQRSGQQIARPNAGTQQQIRSIPPRPRVPRANEETTRQARSRQRVVREPED